MKCAVTGGSGFIGTHVVDYLKKAGHEVLVIDRGIKPHRSDVEFADVDIVNYPAVQEATKGCDFIFHLAAVSNVNIAFKNPVYAVELNTLGTVNVLEAARQNGSKRVVLASTVWVYTGCKGKNVDEDSPFYMPGAGHIYSSTKIASELFCHDYWELYKQQFTVLRYGIPYGPRMREELLIPIFLKKAFAGEPLTIAGDGSQYRNFIYVEDLAKAHILAMGEKAVNKIYNLEGMRRITVKEVAETVKKLTGDKVEIQYMPARPGDYEGKEVSNAKIEKDLNWKPEVDFEEGMKNTVRWYKEFKNIK